MSVNNVSVTLLCVFYKAFFLIFLDPFLLSDMCYSFMVTQVQLISS